jgi:hypothetical protein
MTTPASGEISIQDIVDEFGGTAPHAMSEYYGVGNVPASGELKMSDFYGQSNIIPSPVGLIVPTTSATTPTGWSAFTSANDRFIVGAGSTYGAGSTGGANTASISGTLSNTGSHTGSSSGSIINGNDGYVAKQAYNGSSGAHSHTISGNVTSLDVYKNFRLLKCTSSGVQLPQNAILLAATSLSGLTNVETSTDRFLRAASSAGGTGGSASASGSITTSNSGGHSHSGGNANPYGGGSISNSNTAGAHSHSASISGTLNTKRKYLSAWTNASANYDLVANGIAMWESATPPAGWYICNGANGTPDLRDYFIRIGNTGNHGTSSGTNSFNWSGSGGNTVSHSHVGGNVGVYVGNGYHGTYGWTHTHNVSGSATAVPPYYGLYFVMYGG